MPTARTPVSTGATLQSLLGQSLPPTAAYEVSRAKIREFAAAIGESSPVSTDLGAAQAAGHPDLVAPPTLAVIAVFQGLDALVEAAGIDYSSVVHGDQRFSYARAVHAGDALITTASVDRVRAMAGATIVTLTCEVRDQHGAEVCTAQSTVVVRQRDEAAGPPVYPGPADTGSGERA